MPESRSTPRCFQRLQRSSDLIMAEGQWRLQHDPRDGGLLVTTCAGAGREEDSNPAIAPLRLQILFSGFPGRIILNRRALSIEIRKHARRLPLRSLRR